MGTVYEDEGSVMLDGCVLNPGRTPWRIRTSDQLLRRQLL